MNRERLLAVAAAIEKGEPEMQFNMDWFRYRKDCGTACCIAGWTIYLFGDLQHTPYDDIPLKAAEYLDLNAGESSQLFWAEWATTAQGELMSIGQVTAAQAVAHLRKLAQEN